MFSLTYWDSDGYDYLRVTMMSVCASAKKRERNKTCSILVAESSEDITKLSGAGNEPVG